MGFTKVRFEPQGKHIDYSTPLPNPLTLHQTSHTHRWTVPVYDNTTTTIGAGPKPPNWTSVMLDLTRLFHQRPLWWKPISITEAAVTLTDKCSSTVQPDVFLRSTWCSDTVHRHFKLQINARSGGLVQGKPGSHSNCGSIMCVSCMAYRMGQV